jgi:ubiquinone/menaquinone biosynthesis C-methylase UbiE
MTDKRPYTAIPKFYDLLDLPFEYRRYRPLRRLLFKGTGGEVLDAGVGTGRNMPFYPPGATMTGIDLSPGMLARAEDRKKALGIATDLHQVNVTGTGLADGRFDFIIATFLFCVLGDDDQLPALRELRRICKPDGEIRILEYEYSKIPWTRFVMRLWAPWVRLMYGAAFDRHTERYVDAAGLRLVEERFVFKDVIKILILRPR